MSWRVRVRRHKLNRTHDAFNGNVSLLEDLDESYGGRLEICKMVFGGCKPFSTRKTDCLAETVKKHGEESARRVFAFVGIDPPTFPIPKGFYHAVNYVANMSNILKESVYGEFKADCYVVKDGMDVACLQLYVKFEPVNNYDSDQDDD
ncbi:uncharacterized protein LOC133525163 [Cydia pomonella]|uniref:uncharacterized protein LOC133525163 n=1 Tax=Cydia pomonella TaxID=82600 RepID=UPI002ADDF649|nr:uncharacterized protein LOC133525163 [Cydia pomonella]